MTGYIRNDTTNNIANGNVINANDLDGEFDAIQSAFDASTGHTHDGTVGSGAPIEVLGPAQDVVVTATVIRPKTDNAVDLGTSSLEFKNLYLDGTAQVDTLQVDESATITANLTVNGNTTLGNAATDTVTVTADVASSLIPATDNTYDLGTPTDEWRDLYIDGTANIDSLVADTADINGGTIDGAVIGGSSAAAGTFTTATATTGNITTVNATTVDTTNIEVTNIKAKDGTASATIADTTGVMTIASAVLTTADINGGTIDGTTIGGSSAAAGTFTTATATTGNITTVNATTVDTTNIEVTNIKAKDGTAAGSIADSTGVVTLASSVLTTTDINGGTIDGAVIGGSSAAAITGTTITATGDVTIADKIVHAGDTNTSIRFLADDTVTVETSGAERLRIASTGNVGIGTTVPESKLNVVGDQIVIAGGSTLASLGIQIKGTVLEALPAAQVQGYIATGNSAIGLAGDLLIAPRTSAATSVRFITGTTPAERMRIDGSGNVGIGTNAPTFTSGSGLEVERTDANATLRLQRAGTSPSSMEIRSGANTGEISVTSASPLIFGTSGTERMRIDSSGDVGIGTASPAQRLHVKGVSGSPAIQVETSNGTNNSTQPVLTVGTDTLTYQAQIALVREGTSGLLGWSFLTNAVGSPTERMRIDSSGNVGIGTNAPAQRLHVVGQARIVGSVSSGRLDIFGATSATDGAFSLNSTATRSFVIRDEYSAVERMRITSAGAVYIGNGETSATPANGFLLATGGSGTDIAGAAMLIWGGRSTGSAAGGPITFSTSPAGTTGTTLNAATERMRIDSSGRVGIGTTSMAYTLDVRDATGAIISAITASGNAALRAASTASGVARLDLVSSPGTQTISGGVGSVNNMVFSVNSTEAMRIDANRNLLLGGTASPASATASLAIFNGTAPTGSVANGVVLYAEDVSSSSELKVRDEAGNVTTLSPHNFDLIPEGPSEDMAWSYYSERDGKRINVDMLKAIRLLESITGEKLVHIV